MAEINGDIDFVRALTKVPRKNEPVGESINRDRWLAQFIGHVLVPVYGHAKIKSYCRANKGKRFLTMLNMSCVAYAVTLLRDKYRYWHAVMKLEDSLSPDDRLRFKQFRRSRKGFSTEDIERFSIKMNNKFTTRKGKEVGYGNHGFNDKGVKYYRSVKEHLFNLGNTRCYRVLMEWDKFVKLQGLDIEYIPKKLCDNREEEEVREHDAPEEGIVLEGEEGHTAFAGWAAAEEKMQEEINQEETHKANSEHQLGRCGATKESEWQDEDKEDKEDEEDEENEEEEGASKQAESEEASNGTLIQGGCGLEEGDGAVVPGKDDIKTKKGGRGAKRVSTNPNSVTPNAKKGKHQDESDNDESESNEDGNDLEWYKNGNIGFN